MFLLVYASMFLVKHKRQAQFDTPLALLVAFDPLEVPFPTLLAFPFMCFLGDPLTTALETH